MTPSLCEVRGNLPDDFENLLADSLDNGHQFLQRLQTEWLSGANRFSRPGERLLAAVERNRLIGVGGINIDPYLSDTAKGRIRHPQQDSNGNLAVKLLRTFTMQVEALQRYRGKGQQKVTVEHVHVNAGGQAIVGTVHPPDVKKKWKEPDAPRETTQGQDTPLRSPDPERESVPIASGARQTPL